MKITFVSNYINHHQIPFCQACYEKLGEDFIFLQTEPMEEERVAMGWGADLTALPYLRLYYEEETAGKALIADSDLVLFGWSGLEKLAQQRMLAGKPTARVSERIYREGQWKAISPKGLVHKYREHIRFRNQNCWLLCAGAYVASDFALIHSYPGRMLRFGYFPQLRTYTDDQLKAFKSPGVQEREIVSRENPDIVEERNGAAANEAPTNKVPTNGAPTDEAPKNEVPTNGAAMVRNLWAGRFLPLKHPEYALHMAKKLREQGIPFHLEMIGDGEMRDALEAYQKENELEDYVTFRGFLPPEKVRETMERSHIFLFTSNHLEGWGAVVNEAMNSACAVLAGTEAGAVPWLIRHGENGLLYNGEDEADFLTKALYLATHPMECHEMAQKAYQTIVQEWNAEVAATRFLDFAKCVTERKNWQPPAQGPMSRAEVIRPYRKVPRLHSEAERQV